jgi:hypothetical protein
MKRVTLVLVISLSSLGSGIAGARDTESWDNLKQLRAGDNSEVIDQS